MRENKLILTKGEIITSVILGNNDINYKNINSQIKNLIRITRDKIKSKGSTVNEITTRGNFNRKLRDALEINQNAKYKLEVISLKIVKLLNQ